MFIYCYTQRRSFHVISYRRDVQVAKKGRALTTQRKYHINGEMNYKDAERIKVILIHWLEYVLGFIQAQRQFRIAIDSFCITFA